MNSKPQDQRTAVIASDAVAVTVTTVRYDEPLGEVVWLRESSAEGQFHQAVRSALSERLQGWALDQVLGRVFARRPPAREAVEYEGMFSQVRHLMILVQPVADDGSAGTGEPRQVDLLGLFVPAACAEVAVAA